MRFNCGWADGQPASDLRIVQPIHHQRQDVPLALRQVEAGCGSLMGGLDQGLRGFGGKRGATAARIAREFSCRDILEQIANRSNFQGVKSATLIEILKEPTAKLAKNTKLLLVLGVLSALRGGNGGIDKGPDCLTGL